MDLYDARYTSWGGRNYGVQPVPIYRRSVWELQLVVGSAAATFGLGEADRGALVTVGPSGVADHVESRASGLSGSAAENAGDSTPHPWTLSSRSAPRASIPRLEERARLWLFRPASLHGWGAPDRRSSDVAVFHYDTVPIELDTVVGSALWICLAWHSGRHAMLDRLAARLCAEARMLAPVSAAGKTALRRLRSSSVLLDAAAIFLELCAPPRRYDALDPEHLTERAIAWFEANMHSGVGVGDLAAALSVSPSTLNRSFRRTFHRAATEILRERRMSRAAWFLRHGRQPVGEVAEVCGYRDQSAFARAARRYFGVSPRELRRFTSRVDGESNA
ncbi:MAG: helix-turn-helix transcriptional regulator [Spirochaetales bacterium]|nr:helix-turn-helix transcriptional regulator [Spirochaetales bacterium]